MLTLKLCEKKELSCSNFTTDDDESQERGCRRYIGDDPPRLFLEADDNCDVVAGIELFTATTTMAAAMYTTHLENSRRVPTPYLFEANQMVFFVLYICWDTRVNISSGK